MTQFEIHDFRKDCKVLSQVILKLAGNIAKIIRSSFNFQRGFNL